MPPTRPGKSRGATKKNSDAAAKPPRASRAKVNTESEREADVDEDAIYDEQKAQEVLRSIGDHINTRHLDVANDEADDAAYEDGGDDDQDESAARSGPRFIAVADQLADAEALEEASAAVAAQAAVDQHLFIGHNRNTVTAVCTYNHNTIFYADKLGVVTKAVLGSNGREVSRSMLLPHPESSVCCMAVSDTSDSRAKAGMTRTTADLSVTAFVAVGLRSGLIRIWVAESGQHVGDFTLHRTAVTAMTFRIGTSVLVTVSEDKIVRTWSAHHMTSLDKFFGHVAPIQCVAAMRGERAVSCGDDRVPRLWKLDKATQITFQASSSPGDAITFLDDESFLVGTRSGSLLLYETLKRSPVWAVDYAHGYGWGGDGTGLEKEGRPFAAKFGFADPPDDANANAFFGNPVSSLATLPYSDLVASGSCDGFVRLWKVLRPGDESALRTRSLSLLARVAVFGFVNSMAFLSHQELVCGVGKEPRLGRWCVLRAARNGVQRVPLLREAAERAAKRPSTNTLENAKINPDDEARAIQTLVTKARDPTSMQRQLNARRATKAAPNTSPKQQQQKKKVGKKKTMPHH